MIESFSKPRRRVQFGHRHYLVENDPDYVPQYHEDTTDEINNGFDDANHGDENDSEDGSDTGSDDESNTGPVEESTYCSSDE